MTSTEPSRRAPLPGPLGRLAARVYGSEVARRNRRFDAGAGVTRFPIPVISVGNLSVGGTGKTPMVCDILAFCSAASLKPCVAMRGYRARAGVSDEAQEYADRFPTVPVVAQPDRVAGLRALFASDRGRDVGVIVLDDGFQHRRIARDLDIVLLDATRDPFRESLLPAGWLREPVESLRRAHIAVVTHGESAPPGLPGQLIQRALAINPSMTTAVTSHRWAALHTAEPAAAPRNLFGKRVFAACAIGNPAPFLAEAERQTGGPLAGAFLRPDHDPYGAATVRSLIRAATSAGAEYIVTTEKDWAKLRHVSPGEWPCPVVRPRLELKFESGRDAYLRAIAGAVSRTGPAAEA